ncbi:EAL domain-containing protein [Paenibacillus sp. PR3]|uniref:EAL domain-containing protein n=1 Tax=Paenibacillus terricola TaxID=2763503 RepID=A0ABR8MZ30_9BACL|nr:EAL domain-containing protein [Paenibacillus terricola]MBD3921204.1 EAL domain-containing protein [Paenibacillus terricola]
MSRVLKSFDYDELFHHFQPIVEGQSAEVYGYEALIRSESGIGPDRLFQTARQRGELFKLDTVSFETAIESFFGKERAADDESLLFLNLLPSTIGNPLFSSFIAGLEVNYVRYFRRIVVELNESTEEAHLWNTSNFEQGTNLLRKRGFRIALDDTGEGASSLRKFVELKPDVVKLDRYFASGLSDSNQKQRIVNMMAELCRHDALLILEGVETEQDWQIAKRLGVTLGQGYWLGRPALLPCGR